MVEEQVQDEIKWLESQLEARKRELAEKGEGQKEEREMVREVLKEAAGAPTPTPPLSGALSDDAALKAADELKEKEHSEVIEKLVEIAFTKNLLSALKVAQALKNPHLLDDFHDALSDRYYQKLLEARKIT